MRRGGVALVAIVLVGALARMWVPQAQTPALVQPSTTATNGGPNPEQPKPEPHEHSYRVALQEKIRDFFGQEHSPDVIGQEPPCAPPNLSHWCVPRPQWGNIRFVIATVPDPVHSHLSLFFDRSIDAITQGASSQGYFPDRAIMPWHYFEDPKSDETQDQAKLRESFPGLMIFRNEPTPLFLFVVGETPTAGINKEQFHHAIKIIHDIRAGTDVMKTWSTRPEFGVLGPVFSGSLYSLRIILDAYLNNDKNAPNYDENTPSYDGGRTLPVYATVIGTSSIQSFQATAPSQVRMAIFQQDTTAIVEALCAYAVGLHYEGSDIAVLSEGETAYGNARSYTEQDGGPKVCPSAPGLSFPRGISQFRSAYSREFQSNSAPSEPQNGSQQEQRNLRLDLGVTGGDDDSVAPYARAQTPLSQEAVMLGILSVLSLREPKFILLRATDPLDELFLARYLHDKYPQARLVVPIPDLLFPRDEGGQLDGVLGLNTYPLSPAKMNPNLNNLDQSCTPHDGEVLLLFPASSAAVLYNSTSMLLMKLEGMDSQQSALTRVSGRSSPTLLTAGSPKSGSEAATSQLVEARRGGVKADPIPCGMSPDLWLTIVSHNSIRPIKVLRRESGSTFFPSSGAHVPNQSDQSNTGKLLAWYFSYVLCVVLLALHLRRSWADGTLGQGLTPAWFYPAVATFRKKAKILWLGGIILVGIYVVIASAYTPARVGGLYFTILLSVLLWAPLAVFVGLASWDLNKRRGEGHLCWLFLGAAGLASAVGIGYAFWTKQEMVLWQQRALDLTSGVSPATPLLLLLLALYFWSWYSFRGESLVDWRRPQLPGAAELPERYYRLNESAAKWICEVSRPFSVPAWVGGIALGAVVCLALPSLLTGPGRVPLRSLEGRPFDLAYSILLGLALVALIATLLRMIALWREFRLMLTALDRVGFRDALRRLSGFEWNVIWNPAWGVDKEGSKLVAREFQTIDRLYASLGCPQDPEPEKNKRLRKNLVAIRAFRERMIQYASLGDPQDPEPEQSKSLRRNLVAIRAFPERMIQYTSLGGTQHPEPEKNKSLRRNLAAIRAFRNWMIGTGRAQTKFPRLPSSAVLLMRPFQRIQWRFARTAGLLCRSFLDESWQHLPAENVSKRSDDQTAESSGTTITVGAALIRVGTSEETDHPPVDPSGLSHHSLQLAEEFVAGVYANFLVTVLLRVRGLVFSAVAIYVCIVFSTISYPFEPAPELRTLALLLFIFIGAVIGYVYEGMHRDPTLSRMTSTEPGKLDAAFWAKLVSAGIVPLVALVSTVYPPFGHLLYSLVGPLLQALR